MVALIHPADLTPVPGLTLYDEAHADLRRAITEAQTLTDAAYTRYQDDPTPEHWSAYREHSARHGTLIEAGAIMSLGYAAAWTAPGGVLADELQEATR